MAGVQRALHGPVVVQAGVRHFDQQQYVGRPGMGVPIEIRPWPEQYEVRLRLVEVIKPNRALHRDNGTIADRMHQRMIEHC